jgi:hypothetical protein
MVRRTLMVHPLYLSISLVMANLLTGPSAPNAMGEEPLNSPFLTNSMERWQTPDGRPAPAAWECQDGLIHLKRGSDIPRGGNLVTKDEFGDFELSFDFKVAKSGNSGIKYRVRNYGGRWLGFEYQIYDDNSVKKVEPKNSTGSIYDLYEPNQEKLLHPAGEWNSAKIVAKGPALEHWLNGKKIVSATIGDSDWDRRYQASKFNDADGFGKTFRGKLMLTDHGSEVWMRNIQFKSLDSSQQKQ